MTELTGKDEVHIWWSSRLPKRIILELPTSHIIQCAVCGGSVATTLLVPATEVGFVPMLKQCRCGQETT